MIGTLLLTCLLVALAAAYVLQPLFQENISEERSSGEHLSYENGDRLRQRLEADIRRKREDRS